MSIGIPPKLIDVIRDLYTNTVSFVRLNGALSDWFHFGSEVRQGCTVAPSLFLLLVDWILHRVIHRGFLGATLGTEIFTDLDYADDVALLAEMLEVLLLALDVLNDEARPLGLEVNWQKTKIQSTIDYPVISLYLATLLRLWSHSSISALKFIVQAAQNQKCFVELVWPKAVSTF